MAWDLGASVGDMSSMFGNVVPIPTPSTKITDLSPQVDGGARAQGRRPISGRMTVSSGSKGVAYDAILMIIVLAILWSLFHYSVRAHIL